MRKVSIFAATILLAMLLISCQNAGDPNASNEEQGDENALAMNDGDSKDSSDNEGFGSDTDDDCDDDGCDDDECDDDECDDDECDDDECDDDECDDDECDDDECDDDGDDEGDDGEGEGSVPTFQEGTAENAVLKTWTAIKNGEQQGLAEFISLRAKGDLAELRNGKLAAEKLEELKQQMAQVKLLNTKTSGSSKTVSLQNREGRIFRFTCRKEDGKYLIREFVNKAPSKRKRRGGY